MNMNRKGEIDRAISPVLEVISVPPRYSSSDATLMHVCAASTEMVFQFDLSLLEDFFEAAFMFSWDSRRGLVLALP